MIESQDFEDLFALLNEHDVRFLVVGGYAIAVHARPRFTDDLDLLISRAPEEIDKLCKALEEFGYGPPELSPQSFQRAHQMVRLGVPPYRVDLLTSIKGVEFEQAWTRRFMGAYGSQPVPFIGRADLISSKQAAGRPKDLEDLRILRLSKQEGEREK